MYFFLTEHQSPLGADMVPGHACSSCCTQKPPAYSGKDSFLFLIGGTSHSLPCFIFMSWFQPRDKDPQVHLSIWRIMQQQILVAFLELTLSSCSITNSLRFPASGKRRKEGNFNWAIPRWTQLESQKKKPGMPSVIKTTPQSVRS